MTTQLAKFENRYLATHGGVDFGLLFVPEAVKVYAVDLDPPYQRGHVWTTRQSELYLGYVIDGGRSWPILLNEGHNPGQRDYTTEVVDGKQRLLSILAWNRGEICAELPDGQRIRRADVTGPTGIFQHIRFEFVQMDPVTVMKLYVKLNQGGTVHSEEEINRVRQLIATAEEDE